MADEWLADRFEEHRTHLRAVAYRMLGSRSEADDAIQDAWLRASGADSSGIHNPGGWLTTIVARVCLNRLQSRRVRGEQPLDDLVREPVDSGSDPETDAVLADSVGTALLVVLDTLTPAERLAFVLHDLFAVPFDDIAPIVHRTPMAARQLASRARRRLQGTAGTPVDHTRQRVVVDAFLAASRQGDFSGLLRVLDPDVVLRADATAVQAANARLAQGAPALASQVRGAATVAKTFSGRAQAAQPALVDATVGAVWAPGGDVRAVIDLTIRGDWIVAIEMLADPAVLRELDVTIL